MFHVKHLNPRYSKKKCETFLLLNVKHNVKDSTRIVTKLDIVVDIAKKIKLL